jgi:uncharacterized Zn finger protein (UPF0148 family)
MAETEITSVACNHCGAPLEIGPTTNFVTCAYCGYKLQVHRSASSVYTEVLESIDQRTQRMEQGLDQIKRQNEIERLDREWAMTRDSMLVRDKEGSASEPSAVGSVIGGVIAIIVGIVVACLVLSDGHVPPFMALFGGVFILVGFFSMIGGVGKAARYRDAQSRYQQQRASLLRDQDPQR